MRPVDQTALDAEASSGTADVARAQVASGVDVINGGEQSRVSFSTYVTQRISGFGGSWDRRIQRDQNELPSVARPRVVQLMRVPMCVGPLSCERLDIAENECDVLLRTVNESQAKPQELVMTAA